MRPKRGNGRIIVPQRIHAHSNLCFLKYSKHSYLVNGNPGFVTQIMDAAGEECRRHGYNLLVNAFSDFSAINRAELIDTATTGGVILLGTEIEREDLSYFDGLQKPFVIVDNALERLPFSTVTMDNAGAVFEAVEYLRSLGHRKIGFLYNSIPSSNDNARRDAFEAAMHQPGLSYSDDLICRVFPTMDGARKSFGEALDRGIALPTAFLANNDSIALGAMRAMQERGIRVPQDISMIGFDGLPFSAMSEPTLTTVDVPCADIGRWAVSIIHQQMRGRIRTTCSIHVSTQLHIRKSTAAPRSSDGVWGKE